MSDRIGTTVHYVSYGTPGGEYTSECRAAVLSTKPSNVPASAQQAADLVVLNPTGLFFNGHVIYSAERRGGTWHHMEDCDE